MKKSFFLKVRRRNTINPPNNIIKTPVLGISERSKVNGLYKTKLVARHTRRTSKGIRTVSSYKRSK